MKTTITQSEYLQALGLMTLASHHIGRLKDIEASLKTLFAVEPQDDETSGIGDPDHIGDAIYTEYSTDELLKTLGVSVEQTADLDMELSLLDALREAVQSCACSLQERDSGHCVDCFVPRAKLAIEKAERQ